MQIRDLSFALIAAVLSFGASICDASASPDAPPGGAIAKLEESSTEEPSVAILDWQRFSDPEALQKQIALLRSRRYKPVALSDALAVIERGGPLPHRAFAMTVDGNARAFASVAWPLFKAAGLPVTLFIPANGGGLSYAELRALQASGVSLAPSGTGKLDPLTANAEEWTADLAEASAIFVREFGAAPEIFAWPGGVFTRETMAAAKAPGYRAGFANYSAPASASQPRFALPRFVLLGVAQELERLPTFLDSVPLKVKDVLPQFYVLKPGMRNPPALGFTLSDPAQRVSGLNCFASTNETPAQLVFAGNRVEVRFDRPFPKGRTKVKCIMPASGGRWSWFGRVFFVP